MFNNFSEIHAVYEIMWKNGSAGQVTDENITRTKKRCKNTETHSQYFNTYCFFSATMAKLTHLNAPSSLMLESFQRTWTLIRRKEEGGDTLFKIIVPRTELDNKAPFTLSSQTTRITM